VDGENRLRPGMFARVFLETDVRRDALVVPKAALSLESIGDTVYVAADGQAQRREVELGYEEGDRVEIRSGVDAGELVVVVGQDGLSPGTPLRILGAGDESEVASDAERPGAPGGRAGGSPATAAGGGGPPSGAGGAPGGWRGGGPPDFSNMTPEQLERVKQRMRDRGMTDEQIEERLRRAREQGDAAGQR